MNKINPLVILTSIIFYAISILTYKFDPDFNLKWLTLFLSLIPLLLVLTAWSFSLFPSRKKMRKKLLAINSYGLLAIVVLAIITRFTLLSAYPLVSVGDELRDGGLNALEIAQGQTKNIFKYGRYNAHGLIIPTITSFFYKIFQSSVLVYRFPAALFSVLDILLIYVLISFLTKNKIASFLGAMCLIALPLHLFYSRTEIVVILSSFLSTTLLLTLFVFFHRKMKKVIDYMSLGTLIGFTFNFHASIKAMSLLVLITIIFSACYQWLSRELKLKQLSLRLFLLLLFVLIGFGPRLLNTLSIESFLHTTRVPVVAEKQFDFTSLDLQKLATNYKKSLLVWISEPTQSWYPDHKPILSPILFSLMLIGIIVGFIKKNRFLITVALITLALHLSNSALTDIINGDHRLSPLFPISPVFIGNGIAYIIKKIKIKPIKYVFALTLCLVLIYQTSLFFIDQPSNKNKDVGDYLSMHAIYLIKSNDDLNKSEQLTFLVSPSNFEKYNFLHYQEQYRFFLPNKKIVVENRNNIDNDAIYIKNDSNPVVRQYVMKCEGKNSFYCPVNPQE